MHARIPAPRLSLRIASRIAQVFVLIAVPTVIFRLAASTVNPLIALLSYAAVIGIASSRWGTWPGVVAGVSSGFAYTWFVRGLEPLNVLDMPAWASVTALVLLSICISLLTYNSRARGARSEREQSLRSFSSRLWHIQDEERRKIARELHDSLGQYLTALSINLDLLENPELRSKTGTKVEHIIRESRSIVQEAMVETRTLSYLLHPPMLGEGGFATAALNYVGGFSQRSGIQASVHLPSELQRLPQALELTLFRVLQECLTNVHRHSGSRTVEVQLEEDAEYLVMDIEDRGKGIPCEFLKQFKESTDTTVGLAGMRERVKELGGNLTVDSIPGRTAVHVIIPRSGCVQNNTTGRAHSAA